MRPRPQRGRCCNEGTAAMGRLLQTKARRVRTPARRGGGRRTAVAVVGRRPGQGKQWMQP
eukprot:6800852-Prymnesium_polylepis.3